jgi:hypothetical protein
MAGEMGGIDWASEEHRLCVVDDGGDLFSFGHG